MVLQKLHACSWVSRSFQSHFTQALLNHMLPNSALTPSPLQRVSPPHPDSLCGQPLHLCTCTSHCICRNICFSESLLPDARFLNQEQVFTLTLYEKSISSLIHVFAQIHLCEAFPVNPLHSLSSFPALFFFITLITNLISEIFHLFTLLFICLLPLEAPSTRGQRFSSVTVTVVSPSSKRVSGPEQELNEYLLLHVWTQL